METFYPSVAIKVCELGFAGIAFSNAGVLAVVLDDSHEATLSSLRIWFDQVSEHTNGDQRRWRDEVLRSIDRPGHFIDVPLCLQGTAFQRKVWTELRRIPCGQVRSYTAVANNLHLPGAVRAVANACAANRHAVLIPCHRVIRRDGFLSGFRWGIERKRALLAMEQMTPI